MAAPIEINHISYAKNADPFALTNVLYSILTPGVVYDLKRRTVIDPGRPAPREHCSNTKKTFQEDGSRGLRGSPRHGLDRPATLPSRDSARAGTVAHNRAHRNLSQTSR